MRTFSKRLGRKTQRPTTLTPKNLAQAALVRPVVALLASGLLGAGIISATITVSDPAQAQHIYFAADRVSDRDASQRRAAARSFRRGARAYAQGNIDEALPALEFAAENGVVAARLKLARIYLRGKGLPHEPMIAYRYFRSIADDYAEISPYHPAARHVAAAFVELGKCHRRGISEMGLDPDDAKAADYFVHAASLFGHPEAQYLLARLYLRGAGVRKNVRLARHWLVSASKKGYAPAQAYLGKLLWEGSILKRRPVKAIALVTLAQANAGNGDEAWINVIYRNIVEDSKPAQKRRARKVVAKWRKVYGKNKRRARKPSGTGANSSANSRLNNKAKSIDVRPYQPGEGTEGDSGPIMADPSSSVSQHPRASGGTVSSRNQRSKRNGYRRNQALGIIDGAATTTSGFRQTGTNYPGRR